MRTLQIISFIFIMSQLDGQDTLLHVEDFIYNKVIENKAVVYTRYDKYVSIDKLYKSNDKWYSDGNKDSIVFANNSTIKIYRRTRFMIFDSTLIKIEKKQNIFEISEYYDNNSLKFKATSKTDFPFSFSGIANCYYRNGQKYADYYYNNNKIDSIIVNLPDKSYINDFDMINDSIFLEIRHLIKNNLFYIRDEDCTYMLFLYIQQNKIIRSIIVRETEFNSDNELLKAVERIDLDTFLKKRITGNILIPIRIILM